MTMSILTVTVLASVLATVTLSAPPVFRLASYYGDHMVLQMEPHQSIIWGYGEENSDIEVNLKEKIYTTTTYQGPDGIQWIWKITLDVMPPSGPFSIEIKHHASMTDVITLRDVLFGDVWLCGGQSNMVFSVTQAFNATMEAMLSYEYPYIRLFTVNLNESEKALYDLESVEEPWSVPSPATVSAGAFKYFSATCWFYGRNLYDHLQYPIGLLVSSYGGTPVEAWSSPDALKVCNRTELQEANNSKKSDIIEAKKNDPNWDAKFGGPGAHSVLWNAMIHPLLNITIKGAIWYQGEANTAPGIKQDSYSCTFPAMIADWRNKFYIGTGGTTDKLFPFGFVQLCTDVDKLWVVDGYPALRWHQTADYGYVPNEKMPNVFMAVAMDLPDPTSPYGSIHPRYKQDVGYRLALAGRAIAYNEKYVNYAGPFPSNITVQSSNDLVSVIYDMKHIQVNQDSGFEVCCSSTKNCTYLSTDWLAAPITSIIGTNGVQISTKHCSGAKLQAIRYAWRDCPCVYKQCTIYDKDSNLPAPLFVFSLKEKIVKWIN